MFDEKVALGLSSLLVLGNIGAGLHPPHERCALHSNDLVMEVINSEGAARSLSNLECLQGAEWRYCRAAAKSCQFQKSSPF